MRQVGDLMQPIEKLIRDKFLPTLFGNDMTVSDNERKLYALPGGLGVDNPVLSALPMYLESLELTKPLKDLIVASKAGWRLTRQSRTQRMQASNEGETHASKEMQKSCGSMSRHSSSGQ